MRQVRVSASGAPSPHGCSHQPCVKRGNPGFLQLYSEDGSGGSRSRGPSPLDNVGPGKLLVRAEGWGP